MLQCRDVTSIAACYTTDFPCPHCFKMLCNTGCKRIVFYKRYPASEEVVVALNNRLKQPMEIEPYGGISAGLVQPKGDLATAIYRGFA